MILCEKQLFDGKLCIRGINDGNCENPQDENPQGPRHRKAPGLARRFPVPYTSIREINYGNYENQ